MGGMLSQPVTDKRSNHGEGQGLRYGLSSMQGWRSEMEDAHDVQIGLKYGLDDWSYFAVFDGHAGKRAATFAAWNLLEFILRDSEFKLDTDHLPEYVCIEPDETREGRDANGQAASANKQPCAGEETKEPSEKAAEENQERTAESSDQQQQSDKPVGHDTEPTGADKESVAEPTTKAEGDEGEPMSKPEFVTLPVLDQQKTVVNAIKSGFLRIDKSMRDGFVMTSDMSGCTAVCTFISPTHFFIANCGDSRAVLFDGYSPKFATEDHKPLNPKERQRIIKAGGYATQRINGTLAVSRALGDFDFKRDEQRGPCEQLVSPEPEVTVIERNPYDEEFLILACDGIWDVFCNTQICQFVKYKLKIEPNLEKVCASVLDVCLHKGSRDNMSIIIVVFENAPKFSEEALARDRKNDEGLKKLVRKYGRRYDDFNDFLYSLNELMKIEFDSNGPLYLPPGVGLIGKYDLIHEIFEKEFEDPKSDDE